MIAYKFLSRDGRAPYSGVTWRPAAETDAGWIEAAEGALEPCRTGVHAAALDDLAYWLADSLWEVELAGEIVRGPQAWIARRGRLVRRVDSWNERAALALGHACYARVEACLARPGVSASAQVHAYAGECKAFLGRGDGTIAAYAAALAHGALAGDGEPAELAFHAERRAQSLLLAHILDLR